MKVVELTQGKVAIVDDEDFIHIACFNWYAHRRKFKGRWNWYAARSVRVPQRKVLLMHCEILGTIGVDHVDSDGLNNRRCNLRPASHSQNNRNQRKASGCSSRFKGVCLRPELSKWQAYIRVDGKRRHLGYFIDEEDAAKAYDSAAAQYFGEFARFNF